jgi:hypothetical protein
MFGISWIELTVFAVPVAVVGALVLAVRLVRRRKGP